MFLKNVFVSVLGVAVVASAAALSAEYRPDDFLTLDLSKAVLSPTPLGPATRFAPVPVKAKSDMRGDGKADGDSHASQARTLPNTVALGRDRQLRAERPHGAARTRLAHRSHGNPLDARAQIVNRRIHVWPCKSGGICDWKQ